MSDSGEAGTIRKAYRLSPVHVQKLEELHERLGVSCETEVIRRAIDALEREVNADEVLRHRASVARALSGEEVA